MDAVQGGGNEGAQEDLRLDTRRRGDADRAVVHPPPVLARANSAAAALRFNIPGTVTSPRLRRCRQRPLNSPHERPLNIPHLAVVTDQPGY